MVQASELWTIIAAQWSIDVLTQDGLSSLHTKALQLQDIIVLDAYAEIRFMLRSDVEAKITGPARFSLEHHGDKDGVPIYAINLLEWDYVEVLSIKESNPEPANNTEKDRESNDSVPSLISSPLPSSKSHLVVKTPDIHIENIAQEWEANLVLSTTHAWVKQLENKWSNILVKKLIAEEETFIAIAKNEVVDFAIGWEKDIEPPTLVSENPVSQEPLLVGVFENFQEEALEVRYELPQEAKTWARAVSYPLDASKSTVFYVPLADENDSLSWNVLWSLDITVGALSPDLLEELRKALWWNFVRVDIEQVKTYHRAWNIQAFTIAYTNLYIRLQRVATALNVPLPIVTLDVQHMQEVAQQAEYLAKHMQWYHELSPLLLQSLWTIAVELRTLDRQPFLSWEERDDNTDDRYKDAVDLLLQESISWSLPSWDIQQQSEYVSELSNMSEFPKGEQSKKNVSQDMYEDITTDLPIQLSEELPILRDINNPIEELDVSEDLWGIQQWEEISERKDWDMLDDLWLMQQKEHASAEDTIDILLQKARSIVDSPRVDPISKDQAW